VSLATIEAGDSTVNWPVSYDVGRCDAADALGITVVAPGIRRDLGVVAFCEASSALCSTDKN